jgi:hypothetical protein
MVLAEFRAAARCSDWLDYPRYRDGDRYVQATRNNDAALPDPPLTWMGTGRHRVRGGLSL